MKKLCFWLLFIVALTCALWRLAPRVAPPVQKEVRHSPSPKSPVGFAAHFNQSAPDRAHDSQIVVPDPNPILQALRGEAKVYGLNIRDQDLRKLSTLVELTLARMATLQAQIAQATSDGHTLTVKIPPYPDEGKALHDSFLEAISDSFDSQTSGDIQDHLGIYFDSLFRGYGIMNQTYVIVPSQSPGVFDLSFQGTTVPGLTPSRLPDDHWMTMFTEFNYQFTSTDLQSAQYSFLQGAFNSVFPNSAPRAAN